MDREKLKKFVLAELKKIIPQEIALENINMPLLDKLIEEFCAKNPKDMEVLNVFSPTDEHMDEINKNPEKAIADGLIDRMQYEQIINRAGLAYQSAEVTRMIKELSDMAFE